MTREQIVGYNFRRLRGLAKLKPKEAAERGDVPITYIYQVQGGKVSFGRDAQDKWAAIFGCSVADFFRDPDEVRPEFPKELHPLLLEVVTVMVSNDEGTKLALEQNIHTFAEKVTEKKELQQLKGDQGAPPLKVPGSSA